MGIESLADGGMKATKRTKMKVTERTLLSKPFLCGEGQRWSE